MGQEIGILGRRGNAENIPKGEDHVHFEIRINGKPVDPASVLNAHCKDIGLGGN